MSEIIGALNVVIAAIYSFLTFRIVKTSKQQAEAIYRPYVTITHRLSSETLISLFIKNTGKTNAQNLKLQIDKDFFQINRSIQEFNIAKHFAFTNVVESFPPESELKFSLISSAALNSESWQNDGQPPVFKIIATYSFSDKTVTEATTIDLRPYHNTFLPEPSVEDRLKKLTEELKEFKELVGKKLVG